MVTRRLDPYRETVRLQGFGNFLDEPRRFLFGRLQFIYQRSNMPVPVSPLDQI
ncbi:hypothetical protein GCM10010402_37980 [Actinomadura luteofluorescens]|nr:hypothetical protein [Actinomadura glauciflava]